MSWTTEAMKNVKQVREAGGSPGRFVQLAMEHLPADAMLPAHIRVGASGNDVMLRCERCDEVHSVQRVADACDFRDRHLYCGQDGAKMWRCPHCDQWEFEALTECRWCGVERQGEVPTMEHAPFSVYGHTVEYTVVVGGNPVATVNCNSLLRAKRAARFMYPEMDVEVRGLGYVWSAAGADG